MTREIIYGKNAVKEVVQGRKRSVHKVEVVKGSKDKFFSDLIGFLREENISWEYVKKDIFKEKVGDNTHQGIIAHVDPYEYVSLNEILTEVEDKKEHLLLVILDHIKDPQNFGAIIRLVEAAGAHGILIPGRRSVEVTPAVVKASSGASEYVNIAKVSNISRTIEELQKRWVWVVGCEGRGKSNYFELDYNKPLALVLGSEGEGISNLVQKRCDYMVTIPMYGKINSLNVATACGIIVFEAVKTRRD